jgi:hypothetical protein
MNVDKLLKIFVPSDHAFFPLFSAGVKNLVKCAELLKKLISENNLEEREKINHQIKDYEHIGDEITVKTFEQLNKSFITPFDREDIHELTGHIDDVVDAINGISRRITLYKPQNLKPVYHKMAGLICQAAREIEICIENLEHASAKRSLIMESCEKVKEIEHKADDLYFEGIQDIFENETDTKALLIQSKLLENLERCVDLQEDITDTIRTILIKMA